MSSEKPIGIYPFLNGGGEMGALTRAKDWSKTEMGPVSEWPQSLRTTLGIVLNSKFPMFLWWGPELVCFYNDAYRPSLGQNGKHPDILGMKAVDAWPEIWEVIYPLIQQVFSGGEATWSEDQLIPIYRNGKLEDVYWTFSYSPVRNESGEVAGVLVTCSETTEKVNTMQLLEKSNQQFYNSIKQAPAAMCILSGPEHKIEIANDLILEIWDKKAEEVLNKPVFEALPEAKNQGLETMLDHVFNSGLKIVENERPLDLLRNGKMDTAYLNFICDVIRDQNDKITRTIIIAFEVTQQVVSRQKVEEAEKRFRDIADSAPVLIWMSDANKFCYFLNKAWLDFTGRTIEQEYGNGWTEGIHPDDLQKCNDIFTASFSKRESFYMEYRLRRADGEYRWISDHGVPNFTQESAFSGFIGACMDIHDRVIFRKKLIENEEKLKIVIDSSELGTWELNVITGEVTFSDRYLEIMGFGKKSVVTHKDLVERLHPGDLEIRTAAFEKAYETGDLHYEARLIWDDQSIHWFEGRGKVFYKEDDGRPENLVGTIRDITDEKTFRKKLQEREQKFRLLADSMPQFVWTADAEGNLNYFNPAFYKYTNLTFNQINNESLRNVLHPEEAEETISKWKESVETGNDMVVEHRLRKHDGEYRWQFCKAIPHKDELGKIQMWVGTSIDIQDQKMFTRELEKQVLERTEELKKSEERYHLMVAEVQDYAILYISPEGTIENWNKGAEKIKGYAAKEIIGKNFSVFYTEDDRRTNLPLTLITQAKKSGRAVQEGWRVRKDGTRFWASVTITAVHNELGDVIGFSKVTHDLTEKKQASDRIRHNAEQLELKNLELEKMNAELKSFAYISSHDLQEPIRKIQTFTARIMDKELSTLSEMGQNYFRRIHDEARRMQTLIEDLLAYSRTSIKELVFKRTDLRELVNEVTAELSEVLAENRGVVEIGEMCDCNVIQFQMRQLLNNLIGNSIKFAKPGEVPHVTISSKIVEGKEVTNASLSSQKKYCHLSIADNGIGFEPQYKERIFEVFQRLHGKDQFKGTGIGLAIVKKIVENHNGTVVATGELNKGATFDIYIPA